MTVIRQEQALMMGLARAEGGTLTLNSDSTLTWKRSGWQRWPLHWGFAKGPAHLDLDLNRATVGTVGRKFPWILLLWGGILMLPFGIFTGWFRQCISVELEMDSYEETKTYCFGIRDVEGWWKDIAAAMPEARVEEASDE